MLEVKKYSPHRAPPYARLILMGIVIGASSIVALASYQAYLLAKAEVVQLQIAQRGYQIAFMQRYLLWYGEVQSVNVSDKTLTAQFRNQYIATDEPLSFTVHADEDTIMIYQQLVAKDGAYVGLSESVEGTLSDIQPRMRVALFLEKIPEKDEVVAKIIIFGNPL